LLTAISAPILPGMAQERRKLKPSRSERKELREAMLPATLELNFTPRGDPDPRLIELARLLGRQLARQNFAAQRSKRGPDTSR
jgi:hypothetical protein